MASPFAGNPFAHRFGTFQAALNDPAVRSTPGGVQMYVWQDLRNYYLSRGEPLPAGAFGAVNQLLNLAGQQRQAALNLSKAVAFAERTGIDQAIVGGHIAPSIDTRPLDAQLGGAQHRVVYETVQVVDGEPVYSYLTHDFGFDLPQSVSALNDVIQQAAQLQAADYGYEWGGVATPAAILSY